MIINGITEVLDISAVAPILKNAALIEKYDGLAPGQSFVLANDESSQAYCRLLSDQYGPDFDWEPLEYGPKKWTIRIAKRSSPGSTETIGAIVAGDYRKSRVLLERDIDFSCEGNRTLSQALDGNAAAISEVLQQWEIVDQNTAEKGLNYQDWSIALLTNYIIQIHHKFVRIQTEFITDLAFKVAGSNSARHPQIGKIADIFASNGELFVAQIQTEEQVLFPPIHELSEKGPQKKAQDIKGTDRFTHTVSILQKQSKDIISNLQQIRALTDHYTPPVYTSGACKILYKLLADYEADALLHLHLENNILFPKVLQIEKN